MYYKARLAALNNVSQQFKVVAILRRGKHTVKITTNTDKTHTSAYRQYPTGSAAACMHAELSALRFAKPGDTLEVMRFHVDGTIAIAKPCPICQAAIAKADLKEVWYSDRSGKMVKLNLKSLSQTKSHIPYGYMGFIKR
jgi:tRNA(Arg) A34 adenosine deaminase TadA